MAHLRNHFPTSCQTTPPTTGITGESPPGKPAGDLRISWGNNSQQAGADAVQTEQAAEIARLKRLLAQREEEVAILKKAAAYFARESR